VRLFKLNDDLSLEIELEKFERDFKQTIDYLNDNEIIKEQQQQETVKQLKEQLNELTMKIQLQSMSLNSK